MTLGYFFSEMGAEVLSLPEAKMLLNDNFLSR